MSSPESHSRAPSDRPPADPGVLPPGPAHEEVDAEHDSPPSVRIMAMVAVLTVVVVVSVIGVWQLVLLMSDAEVQAKELAPTNPVLVELRARDQGRLEGYDAVDRAAGRYQIPVERAMDLLVRRPELMAAPPAASGSAAAGHESHQHGWALSPAGSAPAAPSGNAPPAASGSAPAAPSGSH